MIFRKILLIFFVLGMIYSPLKAEEMTPEKRADIENLLKMTGAASLGKQMSGAMVTGMFESMKKSNPDMDSAKLDIISSEVTVVMDENMDAVMKEIIDIYGNHLTDAEVKGLIQFYSSDLGQKLIKVMPALAQESAGVGMRWGQSLQPLIAKRIEAKLKQQGIKH